MVSSNFVEILVHVGAPSNEADDRNYRALAQAYLDFTPASSSKLVITPVAEAIDVYRPLASIESPNLSFKSVWDNAQSPRLRLQEPQDLPASQSQRPGISQSSWVASPSVIADSQPDNDITIAEYCSPTKVLQHLLQQLESASQPTQLSAPLAIASSPSPPKSAECRDKSPANTTISDFDDTHISATQAVHAAAAPSQPNRTSSECLPSSLASASESHWKRKANPETGQIDPRLVEVAASPEDISVIPSSRPEPETADAKPSKRIRSSHSPIPIVGSSPTLVQNPVVGSVSKDQLEVHAPDPAVSEQELTPADLLTPKLEALAREVDIEKRYTPYRTNTRELRLFERGYWLLDMSDWPRELQTKTWSYVRDYVYYGHAGWAVWCKRTSSFSQIRVFCFGAVVPHIFSLLYVASHRQTNSSGAVWYGGDGKAVVTVGPRPKSKRGGVALKR